MLDPEGFVEVGADTPALRAFLESIVGPQNSFLAAFVSPEIHADAKADGQSADLGRYFSAQTMTAIANQDVSPVGFAEMRMQLVAQNKQLMEQIRAKIPEVADQVTGKLEESFLVDTEVEIGDMVPFEPHYQTERAFAFSMLISAKVTVEGGEGRQNRSSATLTFAHVKNRVVFLYSFGSANDLEWTREAGKAWVESFLLANGVAGDKVAEAPRTKASSGGASMWQRVLIFAVVGGLVGGVVGVITKLSKRGAARPG